MQNRKKIMQHMKSQILLTKWLYAMKSERINIEIIKLMSLINFAYMLNILK